ncbi:hypothetical protein PanWU01x14_208390 [Parasponia andersonii]|uniref:Reverse transcriptase zinc-binding domain-containing protein n=1 Tax=Parasponia andersonii TaxID=3476 RepID=A0A2P5BUX2_PARAD|nr:hypothetical protein PanWU01x14_208390 [Parasponia andersonii]
MRLEFGVYWVWPKDDQTVLLHASGINSKKERRKKLWNAAVIAIFWSIWIERNKRIFDDAKEDLNSIWEKVKYLVALWVYDTRFFKDFSFSDHCRDWSIWM